MITNIPAPDHLDELRCHLQCFLKDQRKKDIEATSSQTQCPVFKRLQCHIGEWMHAYSALSFDRIYCYVLLFSWANKNSLFWRLLNDCQIARPVLVSSLPNWKKPYNGHLISLVFFLVRTVNYGSSFFSNRFMAQARNRWKKTRSVSYSGIKPLWDEAAFPKLIIFLKI